MKKELFKDMARYVFPPLFMDIGRTIKNRITDSKKIEWEYIPEGWRYAETHKQVRGWNVPEILEAYKSKWPKFVAMAEGRGPLGMSHESKLDTNFDVYFHNTIMSFAYAVTLAAHGLNFLTLLDWGGGIGHYFLLAKSVLPEVEIEYHCKDVPILVEHGRQLFPKMNFYSDDSCLNRKYDFVMLGTALQYIEGWAALLKKLSEATKNYLYIAHLPIVLKAPSFVFIQRPYSYGYGTEYLGWCLNKGEFLKSADAAGLELVREFVYGYKPLIYKAPEQNEYRGYLFRLKDRDA